MNPMAEPATLQLQPPQPQPPRCSFSCDRHPEEHFTGFCPSCLCERLSGLDPSSSSRRPPNGLGSSATAAALKALFKGGPSTLAHRNSVTNKPSSSFFAELRRSKSFTASKGEGFPGIFEPQRRSCDVRARSTLSSLFTQDNEQKPLPEQPKSEVRVSLENEVTAIEEIVNEIVEEEETELKTMKDLIDLSHKKSSTRDFKEIAGSVWSAASVFSKRLQKWRQKQKGKKRESKSVVSSRAPGHRKLRDTQSEVADYGFGRRSCDTDPRFSIDATRVSFDGFRYSFDEPRASLDGHLGVKTLPRLPPMLSVVEDDLIHVQRTDTQIPCAEEDGTVPGGTSQTRDYYSDSSSRRRKSLDRSSSIRKTAAAVVAEIDEMKPLSNAKVSPATIDYFHNSGVLSKECDFGDSKSSSVKDYHSQSFEPSSNGLKKASKWKGWNLWGMIYSRWAGGKEEDGRIARLNRVERSLSESWPELRTGSNKIQRSNSSVSFRNSDSFQSGRKSCVELNGNGWKGRGEHSLEHNRSGRYSPSSNHVDSGLWRFYMAPLKGSRRNVSTKAHQNHPHAIPRSVLQLY